MSYHIWTAPPDSTALLAHMCVKLIPGYDTFQKTSLLPVLLLGLTLLALFYVFISFFQIKIKRRQHLVRKKLDPVISKDSLDTAQTTKGKGNDLYLSYSFFYWTWFFLSVDIYILVSKLDLFQAYFSRIPRSCRDSKCYPFSPVPDWVLVLVFTCWYSIYQLIILCDYIASFVWEWIINYYIMDSCIALALEV